MAMIHDEKAEELEQAGLYRRAAARWLTVLDGCRDEDSREWAARQRLRCLQQAETPRPVTDTFGAARPPPHCRKKWDSGSLKGMPSEPSKNPRHADRPEKPECVKNKLALFRLHCTEFYRCV